MRALAIMAFLVWSVVLGGLTIIVGINAAKTYKGTFRGEDEFAWKVKYVKERTITDSAPTPEETDAAWASHRATEAAGQGISLLALLWASKELFLTVGQLWFWGAFFCLCIFLFASLEDTGKRAASA